MKINKIMIVLITKLISKRPEDIINLIRKKNIEVVSFDIFDTLIVRDKIRKPSDLFMILNKEYSKNKEYNIDIYRIRCKAEKRAVSKYGFRDVNYKEIYSSIEEISEEDIRWLMEKEIELELLICKKNSDLAKVYEWCKKNEKKIIITSDMYLPGEVIKKILSINDYDKYDKLYISSEQRCSKASGKLFEKIVIENKIKGNQMLHIGDSLKGDYIMPKKMKINAALIDKFVNE